LGGELQQESSPSTPFPGRNHGKLRPRRRRLTLALGCALAGACASSTSTSTATTDSVLAPAMVVERFLRAANSNDLDTMARLFGTRDGAVAQRESQKDADDWMFALASVLRHTDYQILNEQIVPGRRQEATTGGPPGERPAPL
jgi:hypothetical protein